MHTNAERAVAANNVTDSNPTAHDSVSLHRDPETDEWVFDLSPGLDLLEIARVLSVVQQHALQLLQQQLHDGAAVNAAAKAAANASPMLMTNGLQDLTSNQFAQL